jgi:cell division septal protein FtsQ
MPTERVRITSRHEFLKKSRERKHRQRVYRYGALGAGVVLFLALIVFTFHLSRFQVASVAVTGAAEVSATQVQSAVEAELNGNYLWLFPRRNLWLLPKRGISTAIQERFPIIASVSSAVGSDHQLRVNIAERQPVAVVCPPEPVGESSCYFIDGSGVLFAPAPESKLHNYFIWHVAMPTSPTLGSTIFTPTEWAKLKQLPQALADSVAGTVLADIVIPSATAQDAGDYTITLQRASGNVMLLYNSSSDLAVVLSNLRSALLSQVFLATWNKKGSNLQYLDLRFPPKVFYKFSS